MTAVTGVIVDFIRAELEAQARLPVDQTNDVYGLLSYWMIFEPEADIRTWFSKAIENGTWSYPAALAVFASVGTLSGAQGPVAALGDPNLELLEAAVGLVEAASQLPDEFAVSPEPHWGTDVSFDARLRSVMNALARWAAAHASSQRSGNSDQPSTARKNGDINAET